MFKKSNYKLVVNRNQVTHTHYYNLYICGFAQWPQHIQITIKIQCSATVLKGIIELGFCYLLRIKQWYSFCICREWQTISTPITHECGNLKHPERCACHYQYFWHCSPTADPCLLQLPSYYVGKSIENISACSAAPIISIEEEGRQDFFSSFFFINWIKNEFWFSFPSENECHSKFFHDQWAWDTT